jgi:hypothetical protein
MISLSWVYLPICTAAAVIFSNGVQTPLGVWRKGRIRILAVPEKPFWSKVHIG